MPSNLTIAVVGLGFGRGFVPLYLSHPAVSRVIVVDSNAALAAEVAAAFGIAPVDCRTDISQVLDDPSVDAVHILTPVPTHAQLSVRVMEAGKHCACAVPMATSLVDLERILETRRRTGVNYMMMETSVYTREYFELASAYAAGELGTLTLYRGFHIQNLDGYPQYWQGYPPMHYLTHALSPILELLRTRPVTVSARGAGVLAEERRTGGFNNPFPCEVGLFTLDGTSTVADITMAFFQTGRPFLEGFDVYGDRGGMEWPRDMDGPVTRFAMSGPSGGKRGNTVTTATVEPADRVDTLTPALRPFVRPHSVRLPKMPASVLVESHHGGSHPHLADEFINAIVESREPHVDARRAAQWSAAGIVAHKSALQGGVELRIPSF
jgi:predicted dehydrogenase